MKPGKITLFRFPHTSLESGKLRPALILAKVPGHYQDFLICMISSRKSASVVKYDVFISQESEAFRKSGLKSASYIRSTRLAVVNIDILLGTIGDISDALLKMIRKNLAEWIYPD